MVDDTTAMRAAIAAAATVRTTTSPNPWVGAVVVDASGEIVATGATQPPGGPHAEREALGRVGAAMKKRDDMQKMAESNKAYAHYRW